MARSEAGDDALVRAVASGDEQALAALYDRHAGWLLVRLAHRCSSGDIVDQAIQDTFLVLWQRASSYRGHGEVGAFLWGIAARRLVDILRREHRVGRSDRLAAPHEPVRSAEDEVLRGVEHGRLGAALEQLSPELRVALQATVIDGLSCADAAYLLGIPEGTVKSRCHRARAQLREALA